MLNFKLVFSLFILTASVFLASANHLNDTSCHDYCENSVFYTRGGYNAPSQSCAYLTIQCSQGCDPVTNQCRPEPPRTCNSYCSDGVYRYNGTLVRGLCRYSSTTCEYGCNAENSSCIIPSQQAVETEQNNSATVVSNQNTTVNVTSQSSATVTQDNSTAQTNVTTQQVQTANTSTAAQETRKVNQATDTNEAEVEPPAQQAGESQGQNTLPVNPLISNPCFAGCTAENNLCVPIGIRLADQYCDIDKQLKPQALSGLACNNDFECESNICADGKCSDSGLVQKIIKFITLVLQLFGLEDGNIQQPAAGVNVPADVSGNSNNDVQQVEPPQVQVSPSFNAADNTVELAIDGVSSFDAVILSGPSLEIERVAGFRLGIRDDNPGRTTPHSLVFEYEGPAEASLEDYFESVKQNASNSKPLVMKIKDLSGQERVWWNYTQYVPISIQPGTYRSKRYTFARVSGSTFVIGDTGTFQIDRRVRYDIGRRLRREFPGEVSKNPETDTKIDISGVTSDVYPVVEVNESTQTVILTFDYVEGGGIWQWVLNIAGGFEDKKSMSVITEDPNAPGYELSRMNYYEVWPYKYEQFTGYNQVDKVKERVYIAYSKREPG